MSAALDLSRIVAAKPLPLSEADALVIAAGWLSRYVACATDISQSDAYATLAYIPDDMLRLLDSPQGWSALSVLVIADHGLPPTIILPTLH